MKTKYYLLILTILIFSLFTFQQSYSQIYWAAAASFAGNSGSYVSLPNSGTINISGSFSIDAWINPSTLSGASKGIISKGGTLGTSLRYAIRLNSTGRISVLTNGAPRISSSSLNLIPANKWTHISSTYNSSTGVFSIYLNGVLDTAATVAGAAPIANTDSLFIGISGTSTPFVGDLDEVRLWNRPLSATEVNQYMRTSLGTSTGIYSGLVMSIAFQGENSNADRFKDMSGNNNNAFERNVLLNSPAGDMAGNFFFRPLPTISQNECLELDGTEDYLSAKDTSSLNLDTAITLECWVFPRTTSGCRLISKGTNYALIFTGNTFNALINNNVTLSGSLVPLNQWSYIAFTYRATGEFKFYLNGILSSSASVAPANINVTADSLFIGGAPGSVGDLNGYLDEVRITNKAKTQNEIFVINYASLERSRDQNIIQKNINYSFDGNTLDNIGDGGPRLILRGNARFSHPGQIANQPVSPLNQDDDLLFTRGYYVKTSNKRIPASGTAGTITDSMRINQKTAISDINFFVALNHTRSSDLDIVLIAPNGDSVNVFGNKSTNSLDNNIITTFDDNADSSLINGRYASFYCKLKPENGMNSVFSGDKVEGFWKIRVRDESSTNSGMLYSWGIQVNENDLRHKNLNLKALIQGFYDSTSNVMIPDTLTVKIFTSVLQGTDKAIINHDGNCYLSFPANGTVNNENNFLLQVLHRNSIETWSDQTFKFTNSEALMDFMTLDDMVLGQNVQKVDNSPIRFAIFGGDVDQNGSVDLSDVITVFNSASDFVSGYEDSDVTGDNLVDLADVVLVFNNSNGFVHSVIP